MLNHKILKCAAGQFKEEKYPTEFYTHHLHIIKNAKNINEHLKTTVMSLFFWKLGKVRSYRTPSSSSIGFYDSRGQQYQCVHFTGIHERIIKKAIEENRLASALSFRKGELSYDEFKLCADELTNTSSAIVIPAFYVHIWLPNRYPILDKNVWRAFCYEEGKRISKSTKPRSWDDYESYTSFFRKLITKTKLDNRTVDQGLWVIGARLNNKIST
jgi:hypothetical protein